MAYLIRYYWIKALYQHATSADNQQMSLGRLLIAHKIGFYPFISIESPFSLVPFIVNYLYLSD